MLLHLKIYDMVLSSWKVAFGAEIRQINTANFSYLGIKKHCTIWQIKVER